MKLLDRIKKQPNYKDWMKHWIHVSMIPVGDQWSQMEVAYCYHPDYWCFLVTSDPEDAVNGFYKEEYSYD